MITIQEGHFTSSLDPNFMFRVLGHEVETRDTQSTLSSFGELADVNSCTEELLFGDVGAKSDKLTVDVEDLVLNETEDRLLDGVLDEVFKSVTNVLVEFGEEDFGLFVSQWAHC